MWDGPGDVAGGGLGMREQEASLPEEHRLSQIQE